MAPVLLHLSTVHTLTTCLPPPPRLSAIWGTGAGLYSTLGILELRLFCLESPHSFILAFLFHCLVHKALSICEPTHSALMLEAL